MVQQSGATVETIVVDVIPFLEDDYEHYRRGKITQRQLSNTVRTVIWTRHRAELQGGELVQLTDRLAKRYEAEAASYVH